MDVPTNGKVNITGDNLTLENIQLVNASGQIQQVDISAGNGIFKLDIKELPAGYYILELEKQAYQIIKK